MTSKKSRELHERIRAGVHAGIADALEEHRRAGRRVAVWRNGRVVVMTVERALAAARATESDGV